jgi:hypothetical protein
VVDQQKTSRQTTNSIAPQRGNLFWRLALKFRIALARRLLHIGISVTVLSVLFGPAIMAQAHQINAEDGNPEFVVTDDQLGH